MIDIIIPVYNTPIEDLNRCFESIQKQTYTKFNVYIIDDGSTKEIALYLDEYTKKNKKFKVKHKKNGGVSSARNYGLSQCKSEYLAFVDADDSIEKNFFEEAIKLIQKYNLDQVVGKIKVINQNEINNQATTDNKEFIIYEKNNLFDFMDKTISVYLNKNNFNLKDVATGRIYCKIYKRNNIDNLLFEEKLKLSEDTLFCIDSLNINSKIGVFDSYWYNYYQNEYSALHKKTTYEQIIQLENLIDELTKRKDKIKSNKLKNSFNLRIIDNYFYIFKKMIKLQVCDKEFEKCFKKKDNIINLKKTKYNKYTNYKLNVIIFYYYLVYVPYCIKLLSFKFFKCIIKFKTGGLNRSER